MSAIVSPYTLTLELARAESTTEPFQFRPVAQDYVLHQEGGSFCSASFPWGAQVLADLGELSERHPDRTAMQRLGLLLRSFVMKLGWDRHEENLLRELRQGRPFHLTLRFAAAELYALPWELLALGPSGQHLGELPGCLIRYEWPGARRAPHTTPPPEGGRLVFAWSAAGGPVPVEEHLQALREASARGEYPFDERRDVLGNASLAALRDALATSAEPIAVLHVLCHGSSQASGACGLVLGPHAGRIRTMVLCACRSGDAGPPAGPLGGIAQALHRVGIPAVVASRLPLSGAGSVRVAQALYAELLVRSSSLQDAVLATRAQLAQQADHLDWASLQLYAHAEVGSDFRPFVLRPYRGLLAFQAGDRRFFFGREQLQEQLLRRVEDAMTGALPRFQVVAGASGSGKSSLVRAGLVPAVRRLGWDVVVLRPGEAEAQQGASPRHALSMLGQHLRRQWLADAASPPGSGGDVLEEAQQLRARRPGGHLLLVVDQLEEIFTNLPAPEREAFVRALWALAGARELDIVIVATLRVDDMGECGEIRVDDGGTRLDSVVYADAHHLFVPQLQAEHFQTVIEEPARQVGLALEDGLTELLKRDVGQEPGALPLLEYALDLLWQRREGGRLTHRAYVEIGGVTGALTGTADRIVDGLSAPEQRQARRLLVELVDFRGEGAPSTRRRAWMAQVRPTEEPARTAFDAVLARFVASRLLVTGDADAAPDAPRAVWIEFAHEALIRRWERLGAWLREDGEKVAHLRKLRAEAEAWRAHRDAPDRGASYLLAGVGLSMARTLQQLHPDELTGELARFVEASSEAERRLRRAVRPRWLGARRADSRGPMRLLLLVLALPLLSGVDHLARDLRPDGAERDAPPADAGVVSPPAAEEEPPAERLDRLRAGCTQGRAADCEAACSDGAGDACFRLGKMGSDGRGAPKDRARAAALFRQACELDWAAGCTHLGVAYESGVGVPRDKARAGMLYAQGCDRGDAAGCVNLGGFYWSGPGGVRSVERARSAYQRACKLGLKDGCEGEKQLPP